MTARPHTVYQPAGAAALGTVLGVWAHPDDEAYLSAGLMALARDAGNHVVCVTATHGEHGTDDPDRWPPSRLARTRELEVKASMAILGVDDHRFLGYEDGTLPSVDLDEGIGRVQELIEEIRPDTIVTFGPEGMTGHPDHCTVSRWASEAWARTGRRGQLLQAATTSDFADEFADLHARLPVFGEGLPLRLEAADVALSVVLDDELQDRKLAALRAQATQVGPVIAAFGEDRYRSWFRVENFVDADAGVQAAHLRPVA